MVKTREYGAPNMTSLKNKLISNYVPGVLKRTFVRAYYFLHGLKYYGFKYQCPVCQCNCRSFLPLKEVCDGKFMIDIDIGGVNHPVSGYETLNLDSFICRVCGAQDKARLYALYIRRKLAEKNHVSPIKLVHFAPESGIPNLLKWDSRIDYRSADLFRKDVDDCIDLTSMKPYLDSSFDAFICSHILEHVEDDQSALKELYRILRPGGWGILMVPILLSIDEVYEDSSKQTESERYIHFGLEDHLRVYSKNGFLKRVREVGFSVTEYGAEYFGLKVMKKAGLSSGNILYVVTKLA